MLEAFFNKVVDGSLCKCFTIPFVYNMSLRLLLDHVVNYEMVPSHFHRFRLNVHLECLSAL